MINILWLDKGSVHEYVAATIIWDDKTKAFGPYPTVDCTTLEVARGSILGPGRFGPRIGTQEARL